MTADAKKYAVVRNDGSPLSQECLQDSEAYAWVVADKYTRSNETFAPYTVVELVPVPRPIPARPTAVILGCTVEVVDGILQYKDSCVRVSIGNSASILAAAQLIADTEQWEAEHGAYNVPDAPASAAVGGEWVVVDREGYARWLVDSDGLKYNPPRKIGTYSEACVAQMRYSTEGSQAYAPFRLARLVAEGER